LPNIDSLPSLFRPEGPERRSRNERRLSLPRKGVLSRSERRQSGPPFLERC